MTERAAPIYDRDTGGLWEMASSDSADGGAAQIRGYSAADAAHMFERFLEHRLSQDAFTQWLSHYPSSGPSRDEAVADEIDNAILALRALNEGRRPWREVHRELLDCRSRLSGLARF